MSANGLLVAALCAYAAAALAYAASWRSGGLRSARAATLLFASALALVSWLIAARWLEAGRPPFKTLYESLLLFAWCASVIHLLTERAARLPAIGAGASALLAGGLAYAWARPDLEIAHLPPALQSPWFVPHVVVYFAGYGALLLATVAAAAHLAQPRAGVRAHSRYGPRTLGYEELMHGTIVAGFVLLTAGIVLGAIWAKEAWGDYWGWDPKESWALITWLVYAFYLHARRMPEWRGRRSAWLALAGFAAVVFTYLGMGVLPNAEASAHTYQ